MLVHIVADYGHGDLAFAEVVQRIKLFLPDAEPLLTPVPAFSTRAAGFCIAQLGLNEAPSGTMIYHTIAPRADDATARAGNAGERLAFARLPTGIRVIGVNAGHAFSFAREAATELRWAAPAEGSQFRSRDLFPQAAAAIVLGQVDALDEVLEPSQIRPIPSNQVAYIDGYGNLKTTIASGASLVHPGSRVRLRVGDVTHQALVSDGSFEVPTGELAFAPGSSGWMGADGSETVWMELFLRGGNAWEHFDRPSVGAAIVVGI